MGGFMSLRSVAIPVVLAYLTYVVFFAPQGPVMRPPPTERLAQVATNNQNGLRDVWAYVTGGTSGIGKSLAKDLLTRGYSVAITGTSEKTVNATVTELSALTKGAQKVEGIVLDVFNGEKTIDVLEKLFETKDLRVVIYNIFPEIFIPSYMMDRAVIRNLVVSDGMNLVDAVAFSERTWMKRKQHGVFIGMSSCSAFAAIGGGELYSSLRTFQTTFLVRNAESLMSTSSRYADDRTRQILVATVEIPVVYTPLLEKVMVNEPDMAVVFKVIMWDSDVYARMVLKEVLDKGHSFVSGGYLWRFTRALSYFFPVGFGDANPLSLDPGRLEV